MTAFSHPGLILWRLWTWLLLAVVVCAVSNLVRAQRPVTYLPLLNFVVEVAAEVVEAVVEVVEVVEAVVTTLYRKKATASGSSGNRSTEAAWPMRDN